MLSHRLLHGMSNLPERLSPICPRLVCSSTWVGVGHMVDVLDATGAWFHQTHPGWSSVQSVARVTSHRTLGDKTSTQVRYFLCSHPLRHEHLIASCIRGHWMMEKSNLHWCLDMLFDEDRCRIRKGHGPENFAALRRAVWVYSRGTKATSSVSRCDVRPRPGTLSIVQNFWAFDTLKRPWRRSQPALSISPNLLSPCSCIGRITVMSKRPERFLPTSPRLLCSSTWVGSPFIERCVQAAHGVPPRIGRVRSLNRCIRRRKAVAE